MKLMLDTIKRTSANCSRCGKRLTRKTVEYVKQSFPNGRTELVPVCQDCKGEAQQ